MNSFLRPLLVALTFLLLPSAAMAQQVVQCPNGCRVVQQVQGGNTYDRTNLRRLASSAAMLANSDCCSRLTA